MGGCINHLHTMHQHPPASPPAGHTRRRSECTTPTGSPAAKTLLLSRQAVVTAGEGQVAETRARVSEYKTPAGHGGAGAGVYTRVGLLQAFCIA